MTPLILLTNDDGHDAAGLQALRGRLRERFRVVVVAPAREMSGVSHAISLGRPLSVEDLGDDVHSVDGTPADCVNIALHHVLRERPAVVVSGCNHGANLGDDTCYSGTVGAAREAALLGCTAIAVSRWRGSQRSDYGPAAALTLEIVSALLEGRAALPPGTLLNVNLPDGTPRGVSIARLSRRVYRDPISAQPSAEGRSFLWVGGRPEWEAGPGTDHHALFELGHASLSLLRSDATAGGADADLALAALAGHSAVAAAAGAVAAAEATRAPESR